MALNSFGEESTMALDNIQLSKTAFPDDQITTEYVPKTEYGNTTDTQRCFNAL